jgi:hypothetical protein
MLKGFNKCKKGKNKGVHFDSSQEGENVSSSVGRRGKDMGFGPIHRPLQCTE